MNGIAEHFIDGLPTDQSTDDRFVIGRPDDDIVSRLIGAVWRDGQLKHQHPPHIESSVWG